MDDNGFYITLPSNTSVNLFPENTSSAFTVRLFKPLDLRGEWEVGLVEIQYPRTWYTINKPQIFRICGEPRGCDYVLRAGYYDDLRQLLDAMNTAMTKQADTTHDIRFFYDQTGKIKFAAANVYSFSMGDELARLLGAPVDTPVRKVLYSPDITGGFNSLYVYTDIIEHQLVGDTAAPLLRCVPVQGKTHDFITIIYDEPHYVPINKHHIETIHIEIKSDQNQTVPFRYGKVIVRLHIRPQKKW